MYQNSTDTVKYVDTANTSHNSGERNCGQIEFALGSGNSHQSNQIRPTCTAGKIPAHITAKIVIASEARLIEVRHFWRNKNRMAEISVPAWPIPIHQTKFTMAQPQATGWFKPQTPTPVEMR